MTDVDQDRVATPADQGSRNLVARVIAALVLAPLAVLIAWVGGAWWISLATLTSVGLYVEWLMIVGAVHERSTVAAGIAALVVSGVCLALGSIGYSLIALVAGIAAVTAVSTQMRVWSMAGFCYAAVAQFASMLVRLDGVYGFVALILVLLVVWVTDSGGYFAGESPARSSPGG